MEDLDLSSIMVSTNQIQPVPTAPKPIPEPKPAPPMPVLEESSAANSALVTRVKLYFDTFPAKLKDIKPKKPIESLPEEQLQKLVKEIHYKLGSKTAVDTLAKNSPLMLKMVEDMLAEFTPLRIQGTHMVCFDPDMQDLIKFTIIDSGIGGISMTPQQRLATTLMMTAFQRHTINTLAAPPQQTPGPPQQPEATPATDDKYAGL